MGEEDKKNWEFKGIVVSCIKVDDKGDGTVIFKDSYETGEKARFLVDVKKTGEGEFQGTVISAEDVRIRIDAESGTDATPLFCVHGYNVEISDFYGDIITVLPKFKNKGGKYYPIPVLWPCESRDLWGIDKQRQYEWDQEVWSQNAGKVLKNLVGSVQNSVFPRKSLMMHSMGNHVVFNGACGFQEAPDAQFENIFMVAADVPFDIFHKEPNNNYSSDRQEKVYANKELKATNFYKMLEKTDSQGKKVPKGKVYILHNLYDDALYWSSNATNWENRLGQRGAGMYKWFWNNTWYDDKQKELIRDEYYDYLENIDYKDKISDMEDKVLKYMAIWNWFGRNQIYSISLQFSMI